MGENQGIKKAPVGRPTRMAPRDFFGTCLFVFLEYYGVLVSASTFRSIFGSEPGENKKTPAIAGVQM